MKAALARQHNHACKHSGKFAMLVHQRNPVPQKISLPFQDEPDGILFFNSNPGGKK
jgi:hypothetical protein